jgi:hypothetical protein
MTKARDIASATPAPSTVSATELGYLDGVSSAIQTQLDAKTAKSTLTTTGDIYYASSANTPARLGIGSTDQVLKVTGGIPAWATPAAGGGMTLLNSGGTALTGSSTTVNITTTGYVSLKVYIQAAFQSADNVINLRINGDTGSNYSSVILRTGVSEVKSASATSYYYLTQGCTTSGADVKVLSFVVIEIFNPTSTDYMQIISSGVNGPSGDMRYNVGQGVYDASAAVSSLSFIPVGGTFSGGTAFVYGVK